MYSQTIKLSGGNVDVSFLSQPSQYPWRWSEGFPLCSSSMLYINRLLQTKLLLCTWEDLYLRFLLSISYMRWIILQLALCAKPKETKECSIFCNHLLGFRIIYLSVKCLTGAGGCLGIHWGASEFLPLGTLGPRALLESILVTYFLRKLILIHFSVYLRSSAIWELRILKFPLYS